MVDALAEARGELVANPNTIDSDGESLAGEPFVLLVWLFPLIGVFVAGKLLYDLARRARYGRSTFEMDTYPARIGGRLEGNVHVPRLKPGSDRPPFRVTLGCYDRYVTTRRDSDGDRRRTVHLDEVWSDEATAYPRIRNYVEVAETAVVVIAVGVTNSSVRRSAGTTAAARAA